MAIRSPTTNATPPTSSPSTSSPSEKTSQRLGTSSTNDASSATPSTGVDAHAQTTGQAATNEATARGLLPSADVLEKGEQVASTADKSLLAVQKLGDKMTAGAMDRVQNAAANKARLASGALGKGAAATRAGLANVQAGIDVTQAVRSGNADDITTAAKSVATAAVHDAGLIAQYAGKASTTRLGVATSAGWGVLGAVALPSQVEGSIADVKQAVASGAREDILGAGESAGGTALSAAYTANHALQATSKTVTYAAAKRAAGQALKTATPELTKSASKAVSKAVAEAASKSVLTGASKKVATSAAKEAAEQALRKAAPGLSKVARRAALRSAGKAGAAAATKTSAKALGRAAARFAPGVNIAIAAYDTAIAAKDLADPKASWWKKAASAATAAGSIVSATNIPVVSQVGAGVSFLTGLARDFL